MEVDCYFADGPGKVWVYPGPVKKSDRMQAKLEEYAAEGAEWPLCAQVAHKSGGRRGGGE
jgi:hypothetical protein